MQLSIIMPAFNAESFILESVAKVREFGRAHADFLGEFEIIVVDDGSDDATARVVADKYRDVVSIRLPRNRGKGAAVRRGMLEARGAYRIFMDCDVPYGLDVLEAILGKLRDQGCQVCIGDRHLEGAFFPPERGLARRLSSAVFTILVSRLALRGYRDTQCGVKGFRAEAAEFLFRRSVVNGFAFDVEVLYLAEKRGLAIGRVPVVFENETPSSIRLLRDSAQMLFDLLCLPFRYHFRRLRGLEP